MPSVPQDTQPVIAETLLAGVLLLVLPWLKAEGFTPPSATEVIERLSVGRTQAYAMRSRLEQELPELVRVPGRPKKSERDEGVDDAMAQQRLALSSEVIDYLMAHSCTVSKGKQRTMYLGSFQRFVLEAHERYSSLSLAAFAETVNVPLPTLKDWLRLRVDTPDVDTPDVDAPDVDAPDVDAPDVDTPHVDAPDVDIDDPRMNSEMLTVIAAYREWASNNNGNVPLLPFFRYMREGLGVLRSIDWLRQLLYGSGVRTQRKRQGTSQYAEAIRGLFETFFPNAQLVGDGTEMVVELNGVAYKINLELLIDAYSGAIVGASVRKNEDAAAVINAYNDAVASTGEKPLALLLDNKPSNLTQEVIDHIAPAILMAATPFRPENKAHVEGMFGLLKQDIAQLVVQGKTESELAASILALVVTVWARAVNHRPRKDRNGRTRVELLQQDEPVTEEMRARVIAYFNKVTARIRKARETRAARQDPVKRARIAAALERLGLDDPAGNLLTAIASFPLDAVANGISIFEGKRAAGTLPDGVDGRYLRGIIKNVSDQQELLAIGDAVWNERWATRDAFVLDRVQQRDQILTGHGSPTYRMLENALRAPSPMERSFWIKSVATQVVHHPSVEQKRLYNNLVRRVNTYLDVPSRTRRAVVLHLAANIIPLP